MAAEDGDVEFFVGEFGWFCWCLGRWWWRLWSVGVIVCVIHGVVVGDWYLLRKDHGELCEVLVVVVVVYEVCEMVIVIVVLVLVVIVVVCSTASSLTRGHGVVNALKYCRLGTDTGDCNVWFMSERGSCDVRSRRGGC